MDEEAQWLAALEAAREEKAEYFREEFVAQMGDKAEHFTGLLFYPPAWAYRVQAVLEAGDGTPLQLATSTGRVRLFLRYGLLRFTLDGQALTLTAFRAPPGSPGADSLFVPFRDATSGQISYGAGRYLDLPVGLPGTSMVLDFNEAYNPLCAYSSHFSCPYPPPENTLPVAIPAGEQYED